MAPPLPSNPALTELTDVLGEKRAREVVRTFLQGFPQMLHEVASRERERSRRAAHGLKSSARQMGALELSQLLAAIEEKLARPQAVIEAADLAAIATHFAAAAPPLRTFANG